MEIPTRDSCRSRAVVDRTARGLGPRERRARRGPSVARRIRHAAGSRPLSPGPGQSSPRVVIVDDTLVIDGTPQDDRILISATTRRDTVRVAIGGWHAGRYGPVDRIVVNAGDGNDTVLVSPAVTLPVRINGGRGNDVLRGGSGPDVVMGEEGDDLLIGSDGHDALDTGPGRDRLIASWPMGEIHVGAAAKGDVLRILSTAYTLRPPPHRAGSRTAGSRAQGRPDHRRSGGPRRRARRRLPERVVSSRSRDHAHRSTCRRGRAAAPPSRPLERRRTGTRASHASSWWHFGGPPGPTAVSTRA